MARKGDPLMDGWEIWLGITAAWVTGVVPLALYLRKERSEAEAERTRNAQWRQKIADQVSQNIQSNTTLAKRLVAQGEKSDERFDQMVETTIRLAEIAGRALGRTDNG